MADDFTTNYTNANIAENASPYATVQILGWHGRLRNITESDGLAAGILSAMMCAQGRGDAVAPLFRDTTQGQSDEELMAMFRLVRECITLTVPFVGLPSSMPACFGLVGELRRRGLNAVSGPQRGDIRHDDYTRKGQDTSERIYEGVGNSDVREMIKQYFPDLSYFALTSIFGYIIGGCPILQLKDAELVVAASIVASGATRQARSHCKGSIQLGNSVEALATIVEVAFDLATWNQTPLPGKIDVLQLAEELEATHTT